MQQKRSTLREFTLSRDGNGLHTNFVDFLYKTDEDMLQTWSPCDHQTPPNFYLSPDIYALTHEEIPEYCTAWKNKHPAAATVNGRATIAVLPVRLKAASPSNSEAGGRVY
jgi:hypothetical protein